MSDSSELPLVALSMTPNSICDPAISGVAYNGTVTGVTTYQGAGVADFTDYYFNLYEGTDTTGAPYGTITASAADFIELDSGFYTMRGYNTALGCYSDPVTIEVTEDFILPLIGLTEQGATNCDPNLPNGILTADAGGVIAGHTFKWVDGLNVDDPEWGTVSGTARETAESLLAGDTYTVKVTIDATGCFNTQSRIMSDSSELPLVALSMTPNSICDPAISGVAYNGTVTGVTTYQGAGVADFTDYYFNLYEGTDTTGAPYGTITASAADFIELDSGFYTMRGYNTALGCYSDPVTIEVTEDFILPLIGLTEQGATNCDPNLPNGILTADAGGVIAGHTFKWVDGLNVDDPEWGTVSGTARETAESLLAGDTYTVKVTIDATGCFNTQSRIMNDSSELPVLSLIQTPNNICDPVVAGIAFNGTITGSLDYQGGPVVDFTTFDFNLFEGSDTTGVLLQLISGLDPNYIELEDGDYTVRAYEFSSGCFSDPVSIAVQDNTVLPNTLITQEPNSSCDNAQPNGNIKAYVDAIGNTADHNFIWYDGPTVTPGNETATVGGAGEIITLMGNQNYTVEVISQITGCQSSLSTFLNRIIPTYDLTINVTDIVDCNTPGQIEATVDSSGTGPVADYANYEFYWYRGDVINPGNELPTLTRTLTEVSPGQELYSEDYTVYALNTYTHCVTNDITGYIAAPAPLFDIRSEINFYPAQCRVSEGALTAWVDNGGARDYSYNFYWYDGLNINPGSNFYTDPPVGFSGPILSNDIPDPALTYVGSPQANRNPNEGPTIYNLESGAFSVVVEDPTTGCMEYVEINLPSIITPPTLLGTVKGSEICPYTIGDGIVTIAVQEDSIPVGFDNSDYEFFLYQGVSTDPANQLGAPQFGVPDRFLFTELSNTLAPGYYTVEAIEHISGANCPSIPLTLEIRALALPPVVDLASDLVHNTSCDSTVVNGQIELDVSKDPSDSTGVSTYELIWASTASTSPPDVNGVAAGVLGPYAGLNFGTYEVTVRDEITDCETTESYELFNTPPPILVDETTLVVTDKYFCIPSGHIEIVDINVGGISEPLTDFSYEWFDGAANLSLNTPIGPPADTERIDSTNYATIHEGTYYVIVTKDTASGGIGLGCESAPFSQVILDRTVDPMILMTPGENLACDSSFSTGTLAIEINTGGSIASDYEFSIKSPALAVDSISGYTGPTGTYSEIHLGPGVYEVTVRDVDNECVSINNRTIEDHPSIPYIEAPDLTILDQLICANDGSISVDSVRVNGIAEIPGTNPGQVNYEFTWYDGQAIGPGLGVTGNVLDTSNYSLMEAGGYYFTALRNNDAHEPGEGCESAPYLVQVEDLTVDPTIMLAQTANQACDLLFATGSLMLNVNTGGATASDYEYTITSSELGGPLNGFTNDDGTPEAWTEINLGPGQYAV